MANSNFIELEALLSALPGNLYWLDSNNVYRGSNDRFAKMFNLDSKKDLIGKKNGDLKNIDQFISCIWDKNNLDVIQNGKPTIVEEPCVLDDGTQGIFLSHKLPLFDKESKIIGLLGMSFDITEHKKQENALKQSVEQADLSLEHIVSNMPGHVYWKNKEGIYLGCNDRQARTIGFQFGHQVIGKSDFDLPWGFDAATKCRENDIRIMETGGKGEIIETALIAGKERIFLSQKTCLKNKQNEVMGILGISIDITEQKETEKKLITAKEAAESANKLKSEFVQNMEHDIRTPFVGILGMTKILDERETDPDKKQIIADIAVCAQELLDYSCGILDFSEIEGGFFAVSAKKFNLIDLINSIVAIETPAAKTKKLDFTVKYDKAIPKIVIGDEYRLKRILINLLSNAVKFTLKGFIRLTVQHLKRDGRNIILRFIVQDSGIGIEQQKLNTIYEKFSRLVPANQGLYKGQGLGLRIVKQFVEDIDGDIEIESVLGEGSSFICTLNLKVPVFEEN